MHKFFSNKIVVYFNLTAIIFGSLLSFYWYFLDGVLVDKILTTNHITYKTLKTEYKLGEMVMAIPDEFCKLRDLPAEVYINFVDGYKVPYDTYEVNFPIGCVNGKTRALKPVPDILALTKSKEEIGMFKGEIRYYPNPLKVIVIPFETNKFKIIE